MTNQKTYTMLCLGDSYTIGEMVQPHERFPNQAIALLAKQNIHFAEPKIIAKTGWTTDELAAAIKAENITETYDFVTLCIGVNNQYRGRPAEEYRKEFHDLLNQAIGFAGKNKKHVVVFAIPDWGRTPFAEKDPRPRQQISKEIDEYNHINQEEAKQAGVQYYHFESDKGVPAPVMLAEDGLHPSGFCYAYWAKHFAYYISLQLK